MPMIRYAICAVVSLWLALSSASAQSEAPDEMRFYLIGNLADLEGKQVHFLNGLYDVLQSDLTPSHVVFLGDIVDEDGFTDANDARELMPLARFKDLAHVDLYFISGDRDWDNSGPKGLKKAKKLEAFLSEELAIPARFFPENACPGPEHLDIGYNRIIFLNSQWFIHPHKKAGSTDTDCKVLSEQIYPIRLSTFWDELEELIEEAEDRNVILAMHHPVYSNSRIGGKKLNQYHWIPVIGTFYRSFRQNVGTAKDLAHPAYHAFVRNVRDVLTNFESVITVTGHDQTTDIRYERGNVFINSGSIGKRMPQQVDAFTQLATSSRAFIRLDLHRDGSVFARPFSVAGTKAPFSPDEAVMILASPCEEHAEHVAHNTLYNPCAETTEATDPLALPYTSASSTATAIANPVFAAGGLKKWVMGGHYRDVWTTPIDVPYLDLRATHGGLRPYATGGSGQTPSLRFFGGDGNEYYFRSVRKNEEMGMNYVQLNSIYRVLTKDLTSNTVPFAGPIVSALLDQTDILHEVPELYVLPDDPALGDFRQRFGNTLGYLQQRVAKAKHSGQVFGDADYMHSTTKLYRKLFKDNANRVDQKHFARARIFDMWLGDWDRHEDNWKWAGFKTKKGIEYRAVPKDRDRVFSKYEGLVPNIVDFAVPNQEEFGYDIKNVVQLNFNARQIDRLFANALDENDWLEAAAYIQDRMTDDAIQDAINTLPEPFRASTGIEIRDKLIQRRAQLQDVAKRYHAHLARSVDIVGSNKREIFEIERLENGRVHVRVYDRKKGGKKGPLVYDRTFSSDHTKEIRIYGLAARDDIRISGTTNSSILIRVIGGRGKDRITDESFVKGSKRLTRIYDKDDDDKITGGPESRQVRDWKQPVYNPQGFVYDRMAPFVGFRFSSGNKFGLEAQYNRTLQGFNRHPFARQYGFKYIYYPSLGAHRLDVKYKVAHFIGEMGLDIRGRVATFYDKFPFFFGIGNATTYDDDLRDDNFFRTDYFTTQLDARLKRQFWIRSHVSFGLGYGYHHITPLNSDFSIFNTAAFQDVDGLGKEHITYVNVELELDFRDRAFLPQYGSYLHAHQQYGLRWRGENRSFGKTSVSLAHYETWQLGVLTTLGIGAGGSWAYGDVPFYHLAALGSNRFLRGSFRNRYLGHRMVYFNGDLRWRLGTWVTPLLPFYYGVFFFDDVGRVWTRNGELDRDAWNNTFGGGIYLTPIFGKMNLSFFAARSPDREVYFNFEMALDF